MLDASVGLTAARNEVPPICCGHIDRRFNQGEGGSISNRLVTSV
jgi:hypothetical protein